MARSAMCNTGTAGAANDPADVIPIEAGSIDTSGGGGGNIGGGVGGVTKNWVTAGGGENIGTFAAITSVS